jgi:hypothetical protein
MTIGRHIRRTRGPHEALITPATIGHLRRAESPLGNDMAVLSSRRSFKARIPISHSPDNDQVIWTSIRYHNLSPKQSLEIAAGGSEAERVELAYSTPHEAVQLALGRARDSSPAVYDALISNTLLTAKVAEKLMLRAKMGENYSAAAYLEGRLNEMKGNAVRILPRQQAAAPNRIPKRV